MEILIVVLIIIIPMLLILISILIYNFFTQYNKSNKIIKQLSKEQNEILDDSKKRNLLVRLTCTHSAITWSSI